MENHSGVYFIAAGSSSNNRNKTLERAWSNNQIANYVPRSELEKLVLVVYEMATQEWKARL